MQSKVVRIFNADIEEVEGEIYIHLQLYEPGEMSYHTMCIQSKVSSLQEMGNQELKQLAIATGQTNLKDVTDLTGSAVRQVCDDDGSVSWLAAVPPGIAEKFFGRTTTRAAA